jgi:CDP-glycerol glycerophosphotransferase (TagB/SpsB family)
MRAVGRFVYPLMRMMPIDENMVVFSEYWGTGFGCNPRAIYEQMSETAPHLVPVWVISEEKGRSLPPGVRQVRPTDWRRWPYFARAKYFVNNVNFPGTYVKRPGQVHIQTMHGTPLKLCGLDVLDTAAASVAVDPVREPSRSEGRVVKASRERVIHEYTQLLRRSDRWDYAVSSNPYSTEMWSHAYPCSYTWLEVGYPRNDALVRASAEDVQSARARLQVPDGATAILYAPTFREAPGDTSVRIDVARVTEQLPDDVILIVRAHHTATAGKAVRDLIAKGRVIDGSSVPDILTCYLAADALLTDYSSVMFDYALLDRPIMIYADDWLTYREMRGTYFDLIAEPPGHVAVNEGQLVDLIRSGRFSDSESTRLRAAFRERFCAFDRGDAAAEVIRKVMLKGSAPA